MAHRSMIVASIVGAAVVISGCGSSPPSHYYTLDPVAAPASAAVAPPMQNGVIAIGPVTIPAAVERPQFVVQLAPNRVALDEFNRWAGPLDENIARVVAADLTALLGARVTTAQRSNFDAAVQVTIDVQRFDSIPNDAAVFEAVWSVRDIAHGLVHSGRTSVREPAKGEGFEVLAAAHSRALATLSSEIAAQLRADATESR